MSSHSSSSKKSSNSPERSNKRRKFKSEIGKNKYNDDVNEKHDEEVSPHAAEPSSGIKLDENYELQCINSNSINVKNFFQSIGYVVQEAHFSFIKTPDFEGIQTFTMDASHVALVQGRLSCEILGEITPENSSFCVNMKRLNDCLRCAHAQQFLDINRAPGNTDIIIQIHEPDNNTYSPRFGLKTLAKDPDPIDLPSMEYAMHVEVELQEFKGTIKTAKDHGSDTVVFEILQLKNQVGPRKDAFFVISYTADDVSGEFPFSSETNDDENANGRIVIRACEKIPGKNTKGAPSRDECNVLYYGRYNVEYLFLFVKGMERNTVNIYLGDDKPLVLHYPLGCTNSDYIRYLLAQKMETTET